LHRLNAPEASDDYHPAHAALTRVDELKKIAGWAEFTSVPGWDDDFTVNTMQGIDPQWASREVLLALPGVTNEMVERFLQLRRGPDQIDGTEDDVQVTDYQSALGLNRQRVPALQGLITPNSPVYRVVSVGTAKTTTRTVQMVFRRGLMPQLLTWKEF
jgi:hypothetical protein